MFRYYQKTVPSCGDILVVKITKISDNKGAYAESAEYPDMKIFILPTEISRRAVNVQKFFSPHELYPTRVLFADAGKRLADVSYSKLNEKERLEYLERFSIYQKIFRIALDVNTLFFNEGDNDTEPESVPVPVPVPVPVVDDIIFRNTVWKIFDNLIGETNIVVANYYNSILEDPSKFFQYAKDIPKDFIEKYITRLKQRIKISDVILTAEVTILILKNDAVTKLKNILKNDIDPKVEIEYLSSPRYKLIASAYEKADAESLIKKTILTLEENCKKFEGKFIKATDITVQKEKTYYITA